MKGKDTMKAVIGTMAIVLGLSPLLLAAEGEESPTVLYQEALYQEETEGNLDKAIELYGQVLVQAADVEYLAARTLYQLGMCHLKKGDEDTAAVFFRDIVQDYTKQTSVVKKAQAQLDKIAPEEVVRKIILPPKEVVRKITLPDADTPGAKVVLDLASGELLPAYPDPEQLTMFRDLGKGDLAFDRQLICLRGAKASLIVRDLRGEHPAPLKILQQIEGVATVYQLDLGHIPREYLITTAEGDDYEVEILSADSNGMQLSYRTYNPEYANLIKSFTIYDNTVLDLDSGASIVVESKDIPTEFDIGWDNDGGGALMVNPKGSSSIVGLAGVKQGDWIGAIQSARNSLPLLKKKASRGIFANTASFCAVLANQGKLYVVEITDYSPEKATLNVLKLEDLTNKIISPEEIAIIAEKAVLTISTCSETDPRVKKSLESLEGIQEEALVKELTNYLDSETATIRRSAVYILWRGGFSDISAAQEKLLDLCSHEENLTRGMAALALGENKVTDSYDTLVDMTLHDEDAYARRCGAYALGLLGNPKALPILEQAKEDPEDFVKQNAQAAITMLTELNDQL